ncbi:ATP-binding cassette subfamily C member 4-like [Arctopsyche grandis]|uniref:ATP-binding cassette subfamily C member 4-like n=1 Tax=Arctopsyche grandis TaxID=121162 RepID=UPI00406D937F
MNLPENSRKNANFVSKLLFLWMWPLFKRGFNHELLAEDMGKPLDTDISQKLGDKLERNWFLELQSCKKLNKKPSFLRALVKTFIPQYLFDGILVLLQYVGCKSFQPLLLASLLNHITSAESSSSGQTTAALYAGGVVALSLGSVFLQHHATLRQQQLGMRVRIACCSLMYRKILRMSSESFTQITVGQVVNLMSNDVNRFDSVLKFLHIIWVVPIQIGLCCYLYSQKVSSVALLGVLTIVLQTLPLQGFISKLSARLRLKIAQKTDERVRLMDEIICGIQVLKMYAWEKPFEKAVSIARNNEMKFLKQVSYLRAINASFLIFTERFALYITLLGHVLLGHSITAATVYSLAQFYNMLQTMLAYVYPCAVTSAAECFVSIKRIQSFLLLEEKDKPIAILDSDAEMRANLYSQKSVDFFTKPGITKEDSGFINHSYEDHKEDSTDDLKVNVLEYSSSIDSVDMPMIEITNLTASWLREVHHNQATLKNISLSIKKSQLVAVIGSIGGGKSSLFHLILKELTPQLGSLQVNGSVSYASQEPWLFAASIKNNILFGLPYEYRKYKDVVRACALEKDFQQLPQGDQTLVGERGVSLSGGQKSRINLARAVYRKADIYLLDDPLSGLDTPVGNYLFQECFGRYLSGKTCILATHQLQYLKLVDIIVVIDNGRIENIGTYEEFLSSGQDFSKLITAQSPIPQQQDTEENNLTATNSIREISRRISIASTVKSEFDEEEHIEQEQVSEEKVSGLMGWNIYWRYWKSGKHTCILVLMASMLVLSQLSASSTDYWVTYWTNQYFQETTNAEAIGDIYLTASDGNLESFFGIQVYDYTDLNDTSIASNFTDSFIENSTYPDLPKPELKLKSLTDALRQLIGPLTSMQYMYVYTFFILLCIVLSITGCILFFMMCMKSSQSLHEVTFHTILRVPMQFYDTNPSGRILNRFSKDLGTIDEMLPKDMLEAIQILMFMTSAMIMVSITNTWLLVPIVVMVLLFFFLLTVYLRSAQDVKRLEGITRSPVFTHACTTIKGIATIRSSNAQMRLTKEFDSYQDIHTASWYQFLASRTTFGFWLDLTSILFVCCVTFSFIFYRNGKWLSGDVGLAISQSLILASMVQFGVRQLTEVISHLTSVERILQYTDLQQEKGLDKGETNTPDFWPSAGSISFKQVSLSYCEKENPVLDDLNIQIKNGWKVGIVGRTGAGKSSLISALFRLANVRGNIAIDDVETSKISLQDLRCKISIIPQEPILFSASVRYNLDPFNKYDDATLWGILETVSLKESIPSLDFQISEGGLNFSLGQRQLICLARAILKNNQILVLDEATASMDPQTDSFIQNIIREKFAHCTVLTIAHRLNTIIDSDRILVMDAGRSVEFDCPYLLLQKPYSQLSSMVRETGDSMAATLRAIAEKSYVERNPVDCLQKNKLNSICKDDESISYGSMSDEYDS